MFCRYSWHYNFRIKHAECKQSGTTTQQITARYSKQLFSSRSCFSTYEPNTKEAYERKIVKHWFNFSEWRKKQGVCKFCMSRWCPISFCATKREARIKKFFYFCSRLQEVFLEWPWIKCWHCQPYRGTGVKKYIYFCSRLQEVFLEVPWIKCRYCQLYRGTGVKTYLYFCSKCQKVPYPYECLWCKWDQSM